MKRKIAIFLVLCTMAVCLTACGKDTGNVSPNTDGTIGGEAQLPSQAPTQAPGTTEPEQEFDDSMDEFQQGAEDFGNGMEDEMNDITQDWESSTGSAPDPQIRKRSSGTGMTGGR